MGVCWLFAAWSLSTWVWRPNPIPNLSVKRCQFVMALNALGWEGNAKQMDLFAADPYGAMELRPTLLRRRSLLTLGRTMWKQWKNLLPRFYLLLLTWNLYTINNNRGQRDIGRLYPEAAVVI